MLNNFSDKTVKQMSRLKPIYRRPQNQNVFNNMAFVIFCPKHRKIAVSDHFDTQRELAIWFPFLYLSSDVKKRLTIEEGISLILSDGNPELMSLYKEEQPFESNVSFVWSEKIKQFKIGFTRSVCLVRLHSDNSVLQCCRKTSTILWLDIEQISNNYIDCLWGPQIKEYITLFNEYFQTVRTGYYMNTNMFNELPLSNTAEQVLKSLEITDKQIQLFYIDFIEHCFPTYTMSFTSFKDYLGKYGFKTSEKSMKRLYSGFMFYSSTNQRCDNLLFKELLLGLGVIDTQSVFNCSRIAFIFRYYDINRDRYLSKEELREMIEDIHENETSDMIDSIVNDYWFIMNPSESGVSYTQFWQSVHNRTIIIPRSLCRHESRILMRILSILETRNMKRGRISHFKAFVSHYWRNLLKKI